MVITQTDGIDTTEGLIPHLYVERLGLWLTVRVRTQRAVSIKGNFYTQVIMDYAKRPTALRASDGALIYVMPGGGDYVDGKVKS